MNVYASPFPRYNWNQSPVVDYQPPSGCYVRHQIGVAKPTTPNSPCCQMIPPTLFDVVDQYRNGLDREDSREISAKHREQDRQFRATRKESTILFTNKPLETKEIQKLAKGIIPVVVRVYDAKNAENLPGELVLTNASSKIKKKADKSSFTASLNTLAIFEFYLKNFKRDSIDGHNQAIDSSVHFGQNYENAFWNGQQMVFGDGSEYFNPFVNYLDVVGHELTHGVTGYVLDYWGESGALNEHVSDVFGALACQYQMKQTADKANWLIGYEEKLGGILKDPIKKKNYPIRSMENPGTAYDSEIFGKDSQPAQYQNRYIGSEDDGGVHANSGIPNRAFCLAAKEIGGNAWEKAGLVWYVTVHTIRLLKSNATMKEFANATLAVAKKNFNEEPKVSEAILKGWRAVGVLD